MVGAKHLHHVLDHCGGQPLHVSGLPRAVGKAAPGDQRVPVVGRNSSTTSDRPALAMFVRKVVRTRGGVMASRGP